MNKEYEVILENNTNNLSFLYKENKISVKVIYRKRKTISIRIIPKNTIEIIGPKYMSKSYYVFKVILYYSPAPSLSVCSYWPVSSGPLPRSWAYPSWDLKSVTSESYLADGFVPAIP